METHTMSDHEINMAVTCIVNGCEKWSVSESNCSFYHCGVDGSEFYEIECSDYCNDPSLTFPIMIDNDIFITATREGHDFKYMTRCLIDGKQGKGWSCRFTCYSNNPLRVVLESFLKIKAATSDN